MFQANSRCKTSINQERGEYSLFFFVLHKIVPIFESVDQMFQIVSNDMTVTTVQHFPLVLFIALHKVVLTFQ